MVDKFIEIEFSYLYFFWQGTDQIKILGNTTIMSMFFVSCHAELHGIYLQNVVKVKIGTIRNMVACLALEGNII